MKLERSDIFIPQGRILTNKISHQLFTLCQVQIFNLHGMQLHELPRSRKCLCFADNYLLDTKLHDCASAQIAGHQRRIKNRIYVSTDSACILKAIDFGVQYRVPLLNSLVMAFSNDLRAFD